MRISDWSSDVCSSDLIGVGEIIGLQGLAAGGVDFVHRPGQIEPEDGGAPPQPRAVLGQLKNVAAIGALSLEDGRGVVERVGQHMDVGLAPGHQLAVEPDQPVAVVIAALLDYEGLPEFDKEKKRNMSGPPGAMMRWPPREPDRQRN